MITFFLTLFGAEKIFPIFASVCSWVLPPWIPCPWVLPKVRFCCSSSLLVFVSFLQTRRGQKYCFVFWFLLQVLIRCILLFFPPDCPTNIFRFSKLSNRNYLMTLLFRCLFQVVETPTCSTALSALSPLLPAHSAHTEYPVLSLFRMVGPDDRNIL